jgi:dihydrolipoamide dehydrogenase
MSYSTRKSSIARKPKVKRTLPIVKMIADESGRIVGVAIVGDDAIDLIGEAIALIDRGAMATEIAEMPHLHPSMGELLGRVAEDLLALERAAFVDA